MTDSPYSDPIAQFKIKKNRRMDVVAVTIQNFTPPNGKPLVVVDVRLYAINKDGQNRPTARGVSMSIKRLPDLHEAVGKALVKAESLGLLDGSASDESGE